ncbi:MAG: hypothetical protein ACLGGX_01640 [Bdellovibrionia bacterium]
MKKVFNIFVTLSFLFTSHHSWAQWESISEPSAEILQIAEDFRSKKITEEHALALIEKRKTETTLNQADQEIVRDYISADFPIKTPAPENQFQRDLQLGAKDIYSQEFSLSKNEKILLGALALVLVSGWVLKEQGKEIVITSF